MLNKRNEISTVLFDFDGTIADTFTELVAIYNSIAPLYNCLQVLPQDIESLRNKRPQDFMRCYKVTKYNLPFMVVKGRKALRDSIRAVKAFENMTEVLHQLKERGYNLGILSSNSIKNITAFLEANNLSQIFDFIYNSKNIFGKSKKIKRIFKEQGLCHNQVLMVGDETRDIEAAHKMKVPVVAVSWGFNSPVILLKMHPTYMINHPAELLEILA